MGFGDAFIYESALWKNDKKYGYAKCARHKHGYAKCEWSHQGRNGSFLSHSEKLAITLGLIITPQEPVSWLLRMKGDCCDLLEILTNFIISIMDHALVEITSERYGRIFATNDCSCGQFNWLDLSLSLYYNQCYACVWHGWIKKKILCKLKKMSSKRRWSVQIFKKFCNGMRASSSHRKACVRRVVLMSLLPWKFLSP